MLTSLFQRVIVISIQLGQIAQISYLNAYHMDSVRVIHIHQQTRIEWFLGYGLLEAVAATRHGSLLELTGITCSRVKLIKMDREFQAEVGPHYQMVGLCRLILTVMERMIIV